MVPLPNAGRRADDPAIDALADFPSAKRSYGLQLSKGERSCGRSHCITHDLEHSIILYSDLQALFGRHHIAATQGEVSLAPDKLGAQPQPAGGQTGGDDVAVQSPVPDTRDISRE